MLKQISFAFILFAALSGCSSGQKTEHETIADSTAGDSITPRNVIIAQAKPQPIAFPVWINTPRTQEPEEIQASHDVEALLAAYKYKNYLTIPGRRDTSFTINDEDFEHKILESEKEFIYLDSTFQLRAYTSESVYHDMGGSGRFMEIYLFDQDSIVGGVATSYTADEFTQDGLVRITRHACPRCGYNVNIQVGGDTLKEAFNEDRSRSYTAPIQKKIDAITAGIAKYWKIAGPTDGKFVVRVVKPFMGPDGTYSERRTTRYVLSQEIYDNFVTPRQSH